MSSSNTLLLTMKLFLISAGVLSFAIAFKLSAPVAVDSIPATWSLVMSWLKPPYLYLIINGIIIMIAATSRFHTTHSKQVHYDDHSASVPAVQLPEFSSFSAQPVVDTVEEERMVTSPIVVYESDDFSSFSAQPHYDHSVSVVPAIPLPEFSSFSAQPVFKPVVYESDDFSSFTAQPVVEEQEQGPVISSVVVYENEDDLDRIVGVDVEVKRGLVTEEEMVAEKEGGDVFVESTSDDNFISQTKYAEDLGYNTSRQEVISPEIRQLESLFPAREKPLVTSRFGHRKPIRANPEGTKALRVTKPKKQDTLENTWKMITEGRHVPRTRHFKKAEALDQRVTPTTDHVLKADTVKARTNFELSSLRVRKEPSLGQDELNRRVEAFIKKFNEDMRIQRQESLNQYMEMIGRGV